MIELVDSVDTGADRAAHLIARVLRAAPDATVGFATGATPLGLYRRLADDRRQGRVDWSCASAVALDEYVGLGPQHPDSFAAYLAQHVLDPLGIAADRADLLRGDATDLDAECARYEAALARTSVDVQIVGIGRNGHLAFNEPGSPFDGLTRVVELAPETRAANLPSLRSLEKTPARALTQGIGSILRARHLVLLAFGAAKSGALAAALDSPIDTACPASAVQLHPSLTVVADRAAAARLRTRVR